MLNLTTLFVIGGLTISRQKLTKHLRAPGCSRFRLVALLDGNIPIFKPGLDELVASNVKAKRLDFATALTRPAAEADVVFIAVGAQSGAAMVMPT